MSKDSQRVATGKVSIAQFFKKFPDNESARKWFEEQRWGKDEKDRYCPHCGSVRTTTVKHLMPYRCKDCRKCFSIRTKSILSDSNVFYQNWLLAIYLVTTNLKGVSSCKLARDLEATQNTAWFLLHRIRKAFDEQSDNPLLSPIEMDETYVGGLEKNKHKSKRTKGIQGKSTKTKAAIGIKSRVDKKVKVKGAEFVDSKTLEKMIDDTVDLDSTIYTDENRGYSGLTRKGYKHETVSHGVGEYIKEQAHTNGVESFWSMFKRGFAGVYHKMSKKHLQRYTDEYAGGHNNRPLPTMIQLEKVAKGLEGKKLKYEELIA